MSRTMSGIPTSGGGGDVFLAGNPNTFTGTNTFNTNRPTSDLTSTPADEDFITKQVTNWTLNNPSARITINFGVSYDSDIEQAQTLALAAIQKHPGCLKEPSAACFLDNFGDSSVDFLVYFWIKDVNDGYRRVKSEVMFNIWNTLKENNIDFHSLKVMYGLCPRERIGFGLPRLIETPTIFFSLRDR